MSYWRDVQRKGNSAVSLKRKGVHNALSGWVLYGLDPVTDPCVQNRGAAQDELAEEMQLAYTLACFEAHQTVGMASAAQPAGDDILSVNDHLS